MRIEFQNIDLPQNFEEFEKVFSEYKIEDVGLKKKQEIVKISKPNKKSRKELINFFLLLTIFMT